jgi:hypothetical protein
VQAARAVFTVLLLMLGGIPASALVPIAWQKQAPPASKSGPAAPPGSTAFAGQSTPSFNGSAQKAAPNSGANSQFHLNGPGPHKGDWLRKYFALPANQQEQKLEQDPAFRTLPPERQQHLLDRLRKFNSEPPQKKQQILNRMETFEHMTPEQQKAAQGLFQRYHALPDDRRARVSQEYRRLRGMPPEQRAQLMNSDEFRNNFNDDERDLLKGMTDLSVGPNRSE